MAQNGKGIEAITVRRAKLADADKVRYRVYSSPTEFIAVIAESALMAVKVSGIKTPHKIMRDLPTEGIAVEAKKMAAVEAKPERVQFPISTPTPAGFRQTEMKKPGEGDAEFKPMAIADLQRKGGVRARILPPDMLYEIIESHVRTTATPVAAPVEKPAVAAPVAAPAPKAPEPVMDETESILQAPMFESPEQKLTKLADELLPPVNPTPAPAAPVAENPDLLSPDDVAKLLNE